MALEEGAMRVLGIYLSSLTVKLSVFKEKGKIYLHAGNPSKKQILTS